VAKFLEDQQLVSKQATRQFEFVCSAIVNYKANLFNTGKG
jgi:hypothetical protein